MTEKKTLVTQNVKSSADENAETTKKLFPLVYEELHRRAHWNRKKWRGNLTLNTTALVHEVYLSLINQPQAKWESRAHFLVVASKAMRHILVNYARKQNAEKRGGDAPIYSIEEIRLARGEIVLNEDKVTSIVALEEALSHLENVNEREAKVVECRFFGGMTIKETAVALGISERTVRRDWSMARAWLRREMVGAR